MMNPGRMGRMMKRRFNQGRRVAKRMQHAETKMRRAMRRTARRTARRRGCLGLFLF
ncbi:MAG: hypothetical protein JXA21_17670 [Anaerolineae bacterium]|nr:hypothetical protein [Anaerolineae bacterium]